MNKKIFNYFEIAAKLTTSKEDNRSFLLGAIGVRSDGALVKSINSPTEHPNRMAHAEYKLCRKLDTGATVYVARIRLLNGEFAISKPCIDCSKMLKAKRVEKVFYTISNTSYGVWYPANDKERHYIIG